MRMTNDELNPIADLTSGKENQKALKQYLEYRFAPPELSPANAMEFRPISLTDYLEAIEHFATIANEGITSRLGEFIRIHSMYHFKNAQPVSGFGAFLRAMGLDLPDSEVEGAWSGLWLTYGIKKGSLKIGDFISFILALDGTKLGRGEFRGEEVKKREAAFLHLWPHVRKSVDILIPDDVGRGEGSEEKDVKIITIRLHELLYHIVGHRQVMYRDLNDRLYPLDASWSGGHQSLLKANPNPNPNPNWRPPISLESLQRL